MIVTPAEIKEYTTINDATWDKLLIPAIQQVTDFELAETIGVALTARLTHDIEVGTLEGVYDSLWVHFVRPFVIYSVIARCIPELALTIGNAGVGYTGGENINNASGEERQNLLNHYQRVAEAYRTRMLRHCLYNSNLYPELTECDCGNLHRSLISSAGNGLWLGGRRGKGKHGYFSKKDKRWY